jgi:mono/diheme cytochrome c family protein
MMRNIVLAMAAAVLLVSACDSRSGQGGADVQEGAALFISRNCITCHGAGGNGATAGPRLRDLSKHYTIESMIEYLKDPDAAMKRDERLRKRAEGFGALMPKYNYLPEDELKKLSVYVLSL